MFSVGDPFMSGGTVVGELDGTLPSYISMGGEVVCSDGVVPPGCGAPVLVSPGGESIMSGGTVVGDADGVLPSLVSSDGVVALGGGATVFVSPGGESIMSGGTVVGDTDGVLPLLVCSDGISPPDGEASVVVSPVVDPITFGGTAVGDADGVLPSLITPDGDVYCSGCVVGLGGGSFVFTSAVGESIISKVVSPGGVISDSALVALVCDVVALVIVVCVSVLVPSGTVLGCSDMTVTDVSL